MFIDKKGFLLSDACVAVFIVSLCTVIVTAVLTIHTNTNEQLQEKQLTLEERMEKQIGEEEKCIECVVVSP